MLAEPAESVDKENPCPMTGGWFGVVVELMGLLVFLVRVMMVLVVLYYYYGCAAVALGTGSMLEGASEVKWRFTSSCAGEKSRE